MLRDFPSITKKALSCGKAPNRPGYPGEAFPPLDTLTSQGNGKALLQPLPMANTFRLCWQISFHTSLKKKSYCFKKKNPKNSVIYGRISPCLLDVKWFTITIKRLENKTKWQVCIFKITDLSTRGKKNPSFNCTKLCIILASLEVSL